jgi:hypothetical protein
MFSRGCAFGQTGDAEQRERAENHVAPAMYLMEVRFPSPSCQFGVRMNGTADNLDNPPGA